MMNQSDNGRQEDHIIINEASQLLPSPSRINSVDGVVVFFDEKEMGAYSNGFCNDNGWQYVSLFKAAILLTAAVLVVLISATKSEIGLANQGNNVNEFLLSHRNDPIEESWKMDENEIQLSSQRTTGQKKPVLILQLRPEDVTSDNEYEAFLKYGQLSEADTHRLRIEKTGIPFDDLSLDDYSAIIVGGGPFDISEPLQQKTAIQRKIEHDFNRLLDQVIENDFPFFGTCSGIGLLGSYLGATISKKYGEDVGSFPVTLTAEGKRDPLLKNFPDHINVLLGHKEACDDVPNGATLLIQGQNCPVQMIRVKENVYATQFHPEADAEGFTVRIKCYINNGYFKPNETDELINYIAHTDKTPFAQKILQRFVQRYFYQDPGL